MFEDYPSAFLIASAKERPIIMSFTRKIVLVLLWVLSIAAAAFAGMQVYKHREKLRSLIHAAQPGALIQTNLYALEVQKVAVSADGRDGGIAPLGDGVLVASRNGNLWFVDVAKSPPLGTARPCQYF